MQWNTSQKSAIESKNQNILISAGAGSGKTAVLVERILRRVLDPADAMELDKILVVTFTEAAAAEMRQRIGREIQKKLVAEPENTYYRQQFNLLGKASISTIHSFCLDSVRKYFYRLNLEPNFRIADNSEIALLRQEVIDKLFQGAYMNEDTEFLMLVEAYGETKDSKLKDTVFSLFDYARSQPYHHRWLQQLMNQFPHDLAELDKGRWVNELKEEIAVKLEEAKWYYERAQALTEQPGGLINTLTLLITNG